MNESIAEVRNKAGDILLAQACGCVGDGVAQRIVDAVWPAAEARGWANAVAALRDEAQRAEERFRLSRPEGTEWDAYDAAADYLEWFAAQEAHDG